MEVIRAKVLARSNVFAIHFLLLWWILVFIERKLLTIKCVNNRGSNDNFTISFSIFQDRHLHVLRAIVQFNWLFRYFLYCYSKHFLWFFVLSFNDLWVSWHGNGRNWYLRLNKQVEKEPVIIFILSGLHANLWIVRVDGFRQRILEIAIYNFKLTDHLELDFNALTRLNRAKFEVNSFWPISWILSLNRLLFLYRTILDHSLIKNFIIYHRLKFG